MNVYIPTENITDMRGPCPEGFHIPTIDEWNNFRSIYNNIVDSGDRDTATHLYVNMGYCGVFTDNGGSIHFEISKSNANYYRLCENYDTYRAYDTIIMSKSIGQGGPYHLGKSNLYLIRPFSDSVIEPSVGRTTIYQGEGTNGIYHNSTLGIITLIYDTNKITIADRDAGASSAGGQGLQYQRGNNYGFNYSAGNYYSFINSTINASSYGPGNYYNSGTTPRASRMDSTTYFWDSSNNKNLRGGVTGPLKMNELKNAYIGEYVNVTSLTLNKSSISFTAAGQTSQITATIVPAGTPINWTSSNTSVATVTSNGLVTSVAQGSCTITAESYGVTATCSVSISWWTPGTNTMIYLPLENDTLDHSLYNRTITQKGNVTKADIGYLITRPSSGDQGLRSSDTIASMGVTQPYTVNLWVKMQASGCALLYWDSTYRDAGVDFLLRSSNNQMRIESTHPGVPATSAWYSIPTVGSGWNNFVMVINSSIVKVYMNGTLILTENGNYLMTKDVFSIKQYPDTYSTTGMYYSNVILEKGGWTATEISNYYNQTKSKYGL